MWGYPEDIAAVRSWLWLAVIVWCCHVRCHDVGRRTYCGRMETGENFTSSLSSRRSLIRAA